MKMTHCLLNQACVASHSWLLEIVFARVLVCVCMCVRPPLRALITSGVIWCDIGHVCLLCLVKPILQLFSLFLSISWIGVTYVSCTPSKDVKVDAVLSIEGCI